MTAEMGATCERSCAIRQGLDRRIHNQRVALRDNWMIVDMRQRAYRQMNRALYRDLNRLCDLLGIPKGPENSLGSYSIHHRAKLAAEKVAPPHPLPEGER